MANQQVLRIATRTLASVRGGLSKHAAREGVLARTVPEGEPEVVRFIDDMDAAATVVAHARELRKRLRTPGPRPREFVEIVVAGPARYDSPEAWSLDRESAWAREVLGWVRSVFPSAVIGRARLDRDESAPHCHIELVPLLDNGELSWRRLLRETCERLGADSSKRGTAYSALQDNLHEVVSRRYELGRGEPARETGRRHEPIDRSKSIAADEMQCKAVIARMLRGMHMVYRRQDVDPVDVEKFRTNMRVMWEAGAQPHDANEDPTRLLSEYGKRMKPDASRERAQSRGAARGRDAGPGL